CCVLTWLVAVLGESVSDAGWPGPVVRRPILLPCRSVNQSAPSGPAATNNGSLRTVGTGNSLMLPAVVIRPILLPFNSVNQSAPSGPATIPAGSLFVVGTGNSLML